MSHGVKRGFPGIDDDQFGSGPKGRQGHIGGRRHHQTDADMIAVSAGFDNYEADWGGLQCRNGDGSDPIRR
jgi:hypothetical protein